MQIPGPEGYRKSTGSGKSWERFGIMSLLLWKSGISKNTYFTMLSAAKIGYCGLLVCKLRGGAPISTRHWHCLLTCLLTYLLIVCIVHVERMAVAMTERRYCRLHRSLRYVFNASLCRRFHRSSVRPSVRPCLSVCLIHRRRPIYLFIIWLYKIGRTAKTAPSESLLL